MGDAATTTPTDPEQTALRDTMGRILLLVLFGVHPSPGGIFSEPDRRQVLCGNPTISYNPALQYCYDLKRIVYNAANTAAITGMVGIDNKEILAKILTACSQRHG
jgi:hypothetical protein